MSPRSTLKAVAGAPTRQLWDLGAFWAILAAVAVIALGGPNARAQDAAGPRLESVDPQSAPPVPLAPDGGYQALPSPGSNSPGQNSPGPNVAPAPAPGELIEPTPGVVVPPAPAPAPAPRSLGPGVPYSPCCDSFWIASSWNCRQTKPHGCGCGDLEFYRMSVGGPSQLLNRDAFHASLAPGAPICIVVHGSFTNWKGLCDDCGPLYRWLRCPAPARPLNVLFYTWPSNAPITYEPHVDVALLGMRASFNSVYLGDLIARLPPGHPVCLIGHSHGARLMAATLHLLGGGEVDHTRLSYLPRPDQRLRGVFIAGALDHHWLDPGERYGLAVCRAECLLYMRNDHDIVLTFYPLRRVFSRRALGEEGLSRRDRQKLGYLGAKVAQLDVTQVIQMGHMWNHYYSHPELASAIEPYVYFDEGQPVPAVPPGPAPTASGSQAVLSDRSSGQSWSPPPPAPPSAAEETSDREPPRRGVLAGLRGRFLSAKSSNSPR